MSRRKALTGAGRCDLSLEQLERRVLLTVLVGTGVENTVSTTITDASGDQLALSFAGPEGSQVEVLDTTGSGIFAGAAGDNIGSIEFTDTDAYSTFTIVDVNSGVGGDTIVIAGGPPAEGIFTDGSEDMGLISLGYAGFDDQEGAASFGTDVGVTIGGSLGGFMTTGDLDFDEGGTFITTGGDIGMIYAADIYLDSGSGLADVTAGAGGAGNISFFAVDDIYDGTGGSLVDPLVVLSGLPATVADDAATGGSGTLRFSVTGAGAFAGIDAVPVVGGGSVVSAVSFSGNLTVTAQGSGGDLSYVEALGVRDNVLVKGAVDTDIGAVEAYSLLGNVRNTSQGGDIFTVMADAGVASIQTGANGNIGFAFTGPGNSNPLFPQQAGLSGGVTAGGDVGLIQTGSIVDADIEVWGNVTTINTGAGGLVSSDVEVGGNLGTLRGAYAGDSDVEVWGAGTLLQFGQQGVSGCSFLYAGGLTRATIAGDFINSELSAVVTEPGESPWGGPIGSFSARNVSDSDLEALGGFGSLVVSGQLMVSDVNTLFWDPVLLTDVGGGIGTLSLGSIYLAQVTTFGDVRVLRTGTISGGSGDGPVLDIGGNLTSGNIRGSMLDSGMSINGNLTGQLVVSGDLLDDGSYITIKGSSNVLTIQGSLSVGNGIDIGGNSNRLVVRGGGTEGSDIDVGGNSNYMSVGFLDDETDIDIGGDSGTLIVGYLDGESGIYVDGSSRMLQVRGSVNYDADVEVDGDSQVMRIGSLNDDSEVDIGGTSGSLQIGTINYSEVNIDGDSTTLIVNVFENDSWITIDGSSGRLQIGRLSYGSGIDIGGDSNNLVISQASHLDDITIDGSANRISIGGAGGGIDGDFDDLDIGGDLGSLRFGASLVEYDISVGGNVSASSITIAGSTSDVSIDVEGFLGRLNVQGSWDDGDIEAHAGFGSLVFSGTLTDADVESVDYDGYGYPIGGGLNLLQAAALTDVDVTLHGNLGTVNVSGLLGDVHIDLRAYDGYGEDHLVGGGGIRDLRATGLVLSEINTFGAITSVRLGSAGVDIDSSIQTFDATTGDLLSLTTTGLILGDIKVAGDVGTILSAGANAVPPLAPMPSPLDPSSTVDFLFVDADGMPLPGTLAVDGDITGLIS